MKKFCALSLLLLASPFANAAVEFDGTTEINTEETAYTFANEPVDISFDSAGNYTNYYSFTLTSTEDVTFNFDSFGINGNEGVLNLTVSGPDGISRTFGNGQGEGTITFNDLAPDTYLLQVDTRTMDNGSYTLSSSVSPVPEPSTLALMMAGLGLVGFMSNRRRQFV
ncbi:FxDxF family PEP-CTERM protein [Methylophaga sp. OBS3]|uniref:FxDxF family PEP-CTERM protein n=1 Tax=Methylophaga sp. OBS3 TaxID=2991934 RepID=UPI0022527CF6|nr:FxDxF family PEP-CTERM protein [Methylophaga sp. OBS3]MCX4189090.1 FxDxF family PEP-CTERM protein [Methylophaga sp. OBS3]